MPPRSSRRRSLIYNFYDSIDGEKKLMQCKNCSAQIACIVHSLEKHLQSRHKGLFNLYSNNKSLNKSKKYQNRSRSFDDEMEIIEPIIKTENENSFSEVFIETFKPLSDSSSSESDSSSQHRYHNKRKTKRKSRTEEKKSYRRLKDQIDLFQRNVDIKLNYLAGLIQTLVKNQTVQTQKPTCAMSKKTRSDKNRRLKVCSPITIQVPSSSYSARSEELFDCIEMPNFPISDSKTIIEWDQRLKTPEYRLSIATFLIDKAFFNEPTNFRRIKALMFYLFDKKLLSTYTWAGLGWKNSKRSQKPPFKVYNGIMLLVKETINYSCRSEDRILESELIAGLRDSLKRAKEKLIRNSIKEGQELNLSKINTSDETESSDDSKFFGDQDILMNEMISAET